MVMNPNVRKKNGLILNIDAKMRYYGVPDPYARSNEYYKNHSICLLEVTEEEDVGNWEWDELSNTDRWYEQVILPAFREHNEKYDASSGAFNMSALGDALFEM